MYGRRVPVTWMDGDTRRFDYFDLKGVLTALFQALNIPEALVMPAERTPFHPGKGSAVVLKEEVIGGLGELPRDSKPAGRDRGAHSGRRA